MILLHILLFLLKLIGIVLLVILGLIVLILAIVLFTPIRYRIGASKYQTIQAEGKVTWLFRLIEMMFKLDTGAEEGKKLHLSFRIAWLKLYDSQQPKEKRIKSRKSRKTKSKSQSVDVEPDYGSAHVQDAGKTLKAPVQNQMKHTAQTKSETTGTAKPEEDLQNDLEEDGLFLEGAKEPLFEKLLRFIQRAADTIISVIKGIFSLICSILRIPSKVLGGLEKLEAFFTKLRNKKEAFLAFYHEEHNHKWFTAFWQRLKKLLLKILPKADKLYLHFGFDDPAMTGQVLGGLSILYPICGEKMELCPEFASEVLEGDVKFHGHLRLITLVIFAVKSFLNKQFFSIVKQFKSLLRGE